MTEEEKTKQIETKEYQLVEVPTQYAPAIQTPEGDLISDSQAIVMLLNEVKEIKKLIG